jgi:hypothetical protein
MKQPLLVLVSALISGCAGSLTLGAAGPPPPQASVDVDVEAEPVATDSPEEVTATTEPPDPIYEEQTDSPGAGSVWVGGYWGWRGSAWGWNRGRWARPPEGRVYVDPYYERVGDRVVYVRGYWGQHDAPRRSYGGERIHFAAAERPANYHRDDRIAVADSAGLPPGRRPGGAYEHATGSVRPLPRATAPTPRMAAERETGGPRGNEVGHEGMGPAAAHETGHEAAPPAREAEHEHDAARPPMQETGHDAAREPARVGATGPAEPSKKAEPPGRKAPPARTVPARAEPKKDDEKKP